MSVHNNLFVKRNLEVSQLNGLYYPEGDGTSNQVLKTNGSGSLSWADLSSQALEPTDDVQFNNLTLAGNLTVSDRVIQLNKDETGAGITSGTTAGIEVGRGTEANAKLLFDESSDKWTAGLDGGTAYQLTESADTTYTQGVVPAYDANGRLAEAEGLTADTVSSLQNIGSTVIGADKWTALSNLQDISSSASPSLESISIVKPVKHEINVFTDNQTISKSLSIFDTPAPTGDLVVEAGGTLVPAGTYVRRTGKTLNLSGVADDVEQAYFIDETNNKAFMWNFVQLKWKFCDVVHSGGVPSSAPNSITVDEVGDNPLAPFPFTDMPLPDVGGIYSYTSGRTILTATLPDANAHVGETFVIVLRKRFDNLEIKTADLQYIDYTGTMSGSWMTLRADNRTVKLLSIGNNNWVTV